MWRDEAHVLDMLIYARHAVEFNRDGELERFVSDPQRQLATRYALQVIGEAASRVSPEYRSVHPEIPWDRIVGLRHRLVHDYPRIELPKIWAVVDGQLQSLIAQLERLALPEAP
ncbi:MAG: DUF86 domain-containing protein [Candidatus Hydrogenedentes bacterium]|nr:DUF86 domain-containing protein [Candidatus Hydrogenedentota bacterium]